MVCVALVIDVFVRKIVGWRVSISMTTGFVLDALNQAICQRAPSEADKLIHHSDRDSQYLSIKYIERLAELGIGSSVGSVEVSYEFKLVRTSGLNDPANHSKVQNAMTKSVIISGVYATRRGHGRPQVF